MKDNKDLAWLDEIFKPVYAGSCDDDSVTEAKAAIATKLQAAERRGELRGRIAELKDVQYEYGHYLAQTYVTGKAQDIRVRLAELSKEEKQ